MSLDEFNSKYNKSFCIKPFTELCNTPSNKLKLCCRSDYIDVKKDGSSLYEHFLNNDRMNDVRQKMLAGEYIKECSACYKKEEIHGTSARVHHTTLLEDDDPELISKILNHSHTEIRSMDVKFGNKCNLGCVMCDNGASSVLAKEWYNNDVPAGSGLKNLSDDKNLLMTFESSQFESLKEQAKHLQHFSAKGGEPMILPEYHEWIDFLYQNGYSENVEVYVITNGTVDFSRDLEKMNSFQEYEVCWSIDGVGKALEFVRWPVKFKKLANNHKKIIDIVEQNNYKNLKFMINTVAHALNIDQMVSVAEYADSLGPRITQIEYLDCHSPDTMLSGLISEKTLNDFKNQIHQYTGAHKHSLEQLYTEVEYSWHEVRKDQQEFQKKLKGLQLATEFWRSVRGLNVEDHCPSYVDTIAQLK